MSDELDDEANLDDDSATAGANADAASAEAAPEPTGDAQEVEPEPAGDAEEVEAEPKRRRRILNRRNFLRAAGITLVGGTATIYFGRNRLRRAAFNAMADLNLGAQISNFEPDLLFEVLDDNRIQLMIQKAEMGQGVFTGLAMAAAEELHVPYEQMVAVPNSSRRGVIDRIGTGGSGSTIQMFDATREVAATFREMMKRSVAASRQVEVGELETADGHVIVGGERISYYDIVQSTTEWDIPDTPQLIPRSEWVVIGSDVPRVDLRPKVLGDPIYSIDADLPNLLQAVPLRSPYVGGAVADYDADAAMAVPGVVDVVEHDGSLAVVAETRSAAELGKKALGATWSVPRMWEQADIDELVRVGRSNGVPLQVKGDAGDRIDDDGGTVVEAEYRLPAVIHCHMEPNGAMADVGEESAVVITGTQGAGTVRGQAADAAGVDGDNFELRETYLGGGFGRRFTESPAPDAARLSRQQGRPVHLLWDRETEFISGVVRPPSHHVLRAKLDDDNRLIAVEHKLASGDQGLGLLDLPIPLQPILGADIISAGHGSPFIYDGIPNRYAEIAHVELPYMTGIWRGVGMVPNGFAIESFLDEVAHAAGTDPFDLRLANLTGDDENSRRLRESLERLREASDWDGPKPANTGRGLAVVEDRRTVSASVMEVQVIDGRIRVTRSTNTIDPGIAVNPDGIRQQVEGCVMMGISAALYEKAELEGGRFREENFLQYPVATLADCPEVIETIILEGSDDLSGVGEPPIGPIAPAIANAVFDLTGTRLRNLPLQPELDGMT